MVHLWQFGAHLCKLFLANVVRDSFYVEASAGSGKTSLILSECEALVEEHNVPPSQILCITYTNSAVTELLSRCKYKIRASTIHSLCGELIGYSDNIKSIDEIACQKCAEIAYSSTVARAKTIDKNLYEFIIENSPYYNPSIMLNLAKIGSKDIVKKTPKFLSLLKQKLLLSGQNNHQIQSVYDHVMYSLQFLIILNEEYNLSKESIGILDYDDILMEAKKILSSQAGQASLYNFICTTKHLFIDEAQDLSSSEWDIFFFLINSFFESESIKERSIVVVGDRKQSIFGFQGANPEIMSIAIKKLDKLFKKVGSSFKKITLSKSHRTPNNIIERVDKFFNENKWTRELGRNKALKNYGTKKYIGEIKVLQIASEKENRSNLKALDQKILVDSTGEAIFQFIQQSLQSEEKLLSTGSKPKPENFLILFDTRNQSYEYLILRISDAMPKIPLFVDRCGYLPLFLLMNELKWIILSSVYENPNQNYIEQTAIFQKFEKNNYGATTKDLISEIKKNGSSKHQILNSLMDLCSFSDSTNIDVADIFLYLSLIMAKIEDCSDFDSSITKWDAEVMNIQANSLNYFNIKYSPNCLRIMTVHSSKGLEASITVLCTNWRQQQHSNILIDQKTGFISIKPQVIKWDRFVSDLLDQKLEEEKAEQKRLTYVALTRTKEILVLAGQLWNI